MINNNLSSLSIANLADKNTQFFSINTNLKYSGAGRNITKSSDLEYSVEKDSFSIDLSFKANVSKAIIGHNTYDVTAKVDAVTVSYKKGLVLNSLNPFYVNGTTYAFTASSIQIVNITPDPKKDK